MWIAYNWDIANDRGMKIGYQVQFASYKLDDELKENVVNSYYKDNGKNSPTLYEFGKKLYMDKFTPYAIVFENDVPSDIRQCFTDKPRAGFKYGLSQLGEVDSVIEDPAKYISELNGLALDNLKDEFIRKFYNYDDFDTYNLVEKAISDAGYEPILTQITEEEAAKYV